MADDNEVTALLVAWSNGEAAAGIPLMDAVYGELRQLARRYLRHERPDHSLPATALVHEAYVKLVDQRRVRWQNRAHFYAVAAQVMRRLLVDHARAHHAEKRGAAVTISLDGVDRSALARDPDLELLDAALDRLRTLDHRQSQIVELRFFAGLTVDEIAEVLGVAPITVKRDWAMARSWLYRELGDGAV
jgi:RNA polymerase sigma factor (TIGR02999 family)